MVVRRRRDRLEELGAALANVNVHPVVGELGTDAGVEAVADVCHAHAMPSEPVARKVSLHDEVDTKLDRSAQDAARLIRSFGSPQMPGSVMRIAP